MTPYYNKASQAGLIKHYEHMLSRKGVTMALHTPVKTGSLIWGIPPWSAWTQHRNAQGGIPVDAGVK